MDLFIPYHTMDYRTDILFRTFMTFYLLPLLPLKGVSFENVFIIYIPKNKHDSALHFIAYKN